MANTQAMINAWGWAKWPETAGKTIRLETRDLGPGCETCGYGGGVEVVVTADYKHVASLEDDFSSLLNQILEAAREGSQNQPSALPTTGERQ